PVPARARDFLDLDRLGYSYEAFERVTLPNPPPQCDRPWRTILRTQSNGLGRLDRDVAIPLRLPGSVRLRADSSLRLVFRNLTCKSDPRARFEVRLLPPTGEAVALGYLYFYQFTDPGHSAHGEVYQEFLLPPAALGWFANNGIVRLVAIPRPLGGEDTKPD